MKGSSPVPTKVSYDAKDPKKGMSLEELTAAVTSAEGLAESNERALSDLKVRVMINFGAGIKQLIVEV
jgi:hypothetical protein